jgi:hypothetical protein
MILLAASPTYKYLGLVACPRNSIKTIIIISPSSAKSVNTAYQPILLLTVLMRHANIHFHGIYGIYYTHVRFEVFTAVTMNNGVRQLLVIASVVPSSPILVTLMKEALRSSEMSVLTRATQRTILEDATLHSHRSENLKSYMKNGVF